MEFKKQDIFLIPNILTYIRFLCVPFFIWFALDESLVPPYHMMLALGVFLFASLTDVVDGKIARRFNMISDIGKIMDPFADKLLQVSAVICLAIQFNLHWAFAVILLLKETYLVVAAMVLVKKMPKSVNIQANKWGKAAAVFNAIGIILSFFHNIDGANNMYYIDWLFMGIGCFLAMCATIVYTYQILGQIKAASKTHEQKKK